VSNQVVNIEVVKQEPSNPWRLLEEFKPGDVIEVSFDGFGKQIVGKLLVVGGPDLGELQCVDLENHFIQLVDREWRYRLAEQPDDGIVWKSPGWWDGNAFAVKGNGEVWFRCVTDAVVRQCRVGACNIQGKHNFFATPSRVDIKLYFDKADNS
jgi:hypothetical protein